MKKSLALAAVLMALALSAEAATIIKPLPLMTFPKNATYDSTEVAVVAWAPGTAVIAAQDTTAWMEISGLEFPNAISSSVNFLDLQINHQAGAAADSVQYLIQWTSDENTAYSTGTKFTNAAFTEILPASGTNSSVVTALTSSTAGGRFFRVIVYNKKVASGATRKFSIQPILRLSR